MHAFGLLNLHMAATTDYQDNAVGMLAQYVFPELASDNGFMRARACWIYG